MKYEAPANGSTNVRQRRAGGLQPGLFEKVLKNLRLNNRVTARWVLGRNSQEWRKIDGHAQIIQEILRDSARFAGSHVD
jgi:hypothetical protein